MSEADEFEFLEQYLISDEELSELLASNSSSSSESDDDLMPKERRTYLRIKDFVEVAYQSDDFQFKSNFRMRKATFDYLTGIIEEANIIKGNSAGRKEVDVRKALLMTLWFLGNTESYRQISERFDVTRSCSYNVIKKIVHFLVSVSPQYISWPRDAADNIEDFRNKQGIDGIEGAIDGSHIKINRPKLHQEAYCNRKGDHSILLQGVVDSNKRFIDVFCGEAGSIHDARMLKRSGLYEKASRGEILQETFLLGDSAYPSLRWLVPPFKDNGNLTDRHRLFNYKHSSTRIIVENSFGLLKNRFRRLYFFENIKIDFIVECVVAACVLHNICINLDDLEIEGPITYDPEENEDQDYGGEIFPEEYDKRQEVFEQMFL